MELKDIRCEIEKLAQLVEEWTRTGDIAQIERDLALGKLRELYDAVRFAQMPAVVDDVSVPEEFTAVPLSIEIGEILSLDPQPETVPKAVPEPESMPEPTPVYTPAPEPIAEPEPEPTYSPEPESEPIQTPVQELASESDPISGSDDVFEEVVIEIPVNESVNAPEQMASPEVKPAPQPVIGSLFGMEQDDTLRHRQKQRVIMSLYDTEPAVPESPRTSEPEPESTPAAPIFEKPATSSEPEIAQLESIATEPEIASEDNEDDFTFEEVSISSGAVLGEVINQDVQTLGDKFAQPNSPEIRREPVTDLRRAIGINDKFLLINDLFDGDAEEFERVIGTLNGFDDLDDCMIYIADNYIWNSNSDGAKLLMELLERKFA